MPVDEPAQPHVRRHEPMRDEAALTDGCLLLEPPMTRLLGGRAGDGNDAS